MNYYFYNTDASALTGPPRPRFRRLIDQDFAAVGGDRQKYGEQLNQLNQGDILLMYENRIGVVAVGRVLERWDRASHSSPKYYTREEMGSLKGGEHEYRIRVKWFNISDNPIGIPELRNRLGYTPRGAVRKIIDRQAEVETLIAERVPDADDSTLADDLYSIVRRKIDSTTKDALISARVGQGRFRAQVLHLWSNCCSVTKSVTQDAIRASHIKPWSESTDEERLDPHNGLPLVASLDALFDAGLISFEPSGKMIVSSELNMAERHIFGIGEESLTKKPSAKTAEYLVYHRDNHLQQ